MTWLDRILATPCTAHDVPAGLWCRQPLNKPDKSYVCASRIQAAEGAAEQEATNLCPPAWECDLEGDDTCGCSISDKCGCVGEMVCSGPLVGTLIEPEVECKECGAPMVQFEPGPSVCPGRRP